MQRLRHGDLVGYARVSTADQDPALQLDALEAAGCLRVFVDHASGARAARPELERALDSLRPSDTLVVWRLDRLGRSLSDLLKIVQQLEDSGNGFRSLQESLDTNSPAGRLTFHVFGAMAEFERDLIRERTSAGLNAARQRGRTGGRPRAMDDSKRRLALSMVAERDNSGSPAHSVSDIATALGVSRATIYRAIKGSSE